MPLPRNGRKASGGLFRRIRRIKRQFTARCLPAWMCGAPAFVRDEAGGGRSTIASRLERRDRHPWALRNAARLVRYRSGLVGRPKVQRSEEHTSELQSLMRISYAVFCLKKKQK